MTIVVSRGQSRAPAKRELEQAIAERAAAMEGVRVISIPHLYDLPPKGETVQQLREVDGDMTLLSWVYPRAAHWVLDRAGIRGQFGEVELSDVTDALDDDDQDAEAEMDDNPLTDRVIDVQPRPDRQIYSLDLRLRESPEPYLDEIRRIMGLQPVDSGAAPDRPQAEALFKIDEPTGRRWYPVIDFSRCTNCMECIDFCLFGVYGVDDVETILVEQPDNCRKGCPACSRVCPANAIIFPQHKAPAIAGSAISDAGGLKIDLSLLFGAPDKDEDPLAAAARERDEQLILAGRAAVGSEVGMPKRQANAEKKPKDQLDDLLDELDALDL